MKKRSVKFILSNRFKNYTKDKRKLTTIIFIAVIILLAIILISKNYKIAYKVTLNGSELGYITNKEEFTCMVTNQVLNQSNENMEVIVLNNVPEYSPTLVKANQTTDEESIISILKLKADVTYKLYAITLGGEDKAYVDTLEEESDFTKKKEKNRKEEGEVEEEKSEKKERKKKV